MIALLIAVAVTFEQGLALKRAEKLPEATAVFAALVEANPRDVAALEQWATVLGWQQRYDESIAGWRRALEIAPSNPAFGTGLARVLYWKGALDEARTRIAQTLSAAPDSFDALVLAGDIAAAQHDPAAAHGFYQRAQQQDPTVPDLRVKLERTGSPLTSRVDIGGSLDHYNNYRQQEGSAFVQVGTQASENAYLSLGLEQVHQFGFADRRLGLNLDYRASPALTLSARGAVTPGASVLADWEAWGGADLRVLPWLSLLATGRFFSYASGPVGTYGPGVRLDQGRYSLQLQMGFTRAPAGLSESFQARLTTAITDRLGLVLVFARGNEAIPRVAPAVSTVGAAALIFTVTRNWGLRLDYAYEVRDYAHNTLALSANYRF